MFRFEEILYLCQSQQLRDVMSVLGSNDALSLCILLEGILTLPLVCDLGVMQEKSLQEEVADLEHVHLRLTPC